MRKTVSAEQAIDTIQSGMTVMLGGFFFSGSPFRLIREWTARAGELRGLTLVSNDAASELRRPDALGNALVASGMFEKCIASYIGHNAAAMRLIERGELELETLPMGTLAERIRCGGAGIGGFLTPTGLGTVVQEGKEIVRVDGRDFLLEKPLRADVALIYGDSADEHGNVVLRGVARNFNTVMATAADRVIVETPRLVRVGELDPDSVSIPAPYIDQIVVSEGRDYLL